MRLAQQRFLQEARAIDRLDHPNIVHVLNVSYIEGELCIVMELVTGGSLRDYMKRVGRFFPKTGA